MLYFDALIYYYGILIILIKLYKILFNVLECYIRKYLFIWPPKHIPNLLI